MYPNHCLEHLGLSVENDYLKKHVDRCYYQPINITIHKIFELEKE